MHQWGSGRRCSGASQIYLSAWLTSIESKEGDNKKCIWGRSLLVIFLCVGRTTNFLRAPASARGGKEQMHGQWLGVPPFPGRGRSASILVQLMLRQESENFFWHGSQPKESFMRFAVIACATAAGIWTKTLKDITKGLARSQAGSFQATLSPDPWLCATRSS